MESKKFIPADSQEWEAFGPGLERKILGYTDDLDRFDLAMFPADGRIGNGYTLGARQFIDRFSVGMFVPMHFVASGFESV